MRDSEWILLKGFFCKDLVGLLKGLFEDFPGFLGFLGILKAVLATRVVHVSCSCYNRFSLPCKKFEGCLRIEGGVQRILNDVRDLQGKT